MKIHANNIIKHKNYKDVCFYVFTVRGPYGSSLEYELKGVYWNMGFVESYCMNVLDKIRIKKADLDNWLICSNNEEKCLRNVQWV